MRSLISPIFIALILASLVGKSQSLNLIIEDYRYYDRFERKGPRSNGVRVDCWKDISEKGIVYAEYCFTKSGAPCDTWKVFKPNGKLRKEYQFKDEKVIRYSLFSSDSTKSFELTSIVKIPDSTLKRLIDREEKFLVELRTLSKIYNPKNIPAKGNELELDYYYVINELLQVVLDSEFSGNLDMWHEDGRHWKRYTFDSGKVRYIADFQDRKRNLIEQDEYDSGKLIKKTFYNTDGTIKRIKVY